MNLELTNEQQAFQAEIQQFAREIVAPRAAGIDKSGEFPDDVIHAAAGHGRSRSPARSCRATVERRHELHDGRGKRARPAGGSVVDAGSIETDLREAGS